MASKDGHAKPARLLLELRSWASLPERIATSELRELVILLERCQDVLRQRDSSDLTRGGEPSHWFERSERMLSPRVRDVLRQLKDGRSEKEAARALGLSHNTVHHYVKVIYRSFNVSSRSELLALWVQVA